VAVTSDPVIERDDGMHGRPGAVRALRSPRNWPTALVALAAALLGAACTARLWLDPAGQMVSGNIPDAIHYSWWLAHTPFAVLQGQSPLSTDAMNWPQGVGTMNNTTLLLPSVILWPITWLFGSLTTLNLLTVLSVPACIAAAYWALRQRDVVHGRSGQQVCRSAALAGAAAFGISPAIVNSLVGHVTMSFAPALPVLLVLGVRAWSSQRSWRAGVLLGVVATAQVFIGEEVLFQAGYANLVVLLVAGASRPMAIPAALPRLARSLGTALAILAVVAGYPLYLQFFGPLSQHGNPFLPDYYGADLTSFYTSSDRLLLHTQAGAAATLRFPGGVEEHLSYLGVPLLVVCLVVAVTGWRRLAVRCAAVGLLLTLVLQLGGRVWIDGEWTTLRGPYALLQALPVVEASLATRLALPAALFAGVLLAVGVQDLLTRSPLSVLSPRQRGGLAAAVALASLAPLIPATLPVEDAPAVPEYFTTSARSLPDEAVLLVVPYPVAAQPVAMRWQMASGFAFRMPGGYFLGPGPEGKAFVGGSADPALGRALAAVAQTGQPLVLTPGLTAQYRADLQAWRPDAIVLGPAPAHAALRSSLTALLGQSPVSTGGVDVWTDPVELLR
jgi:hypothetical protein